MESAYCIGKTKERVEESLRSISSRLRFPVHSVKQSPAPAV